MDVANPQSPANNDNEVDNIEKVYRKRWTWYLYYSSYS
jgi:hypothetical protein